MAATVFLFLSPPRFRPIATILGAINAAGTGVSTLIGGWHRASDVVAAMLITLVFAGLALLLDRPRTRVVTGDHIAVIVLAVVGVLTAIVSLRDLIYLWRGLGT